MKELLGISLERWSLYSIYWAVNLILALTDLDLTSLKYVSLSRKYMNNPRGLTEFHFRLLSGLGGMCYSTGSCNNLFQEIC